MKTRVAVSWSGGKDSVVTLDRLLRDERYEIVALLTTIDENSRRVSAHGVRADLIQRQAESIGLPLLLVQLPPNPSNASYVDRFARAVAGTRAGTVAFGDIF
jgi:diphthamide synthase (EF-2-diphthine--ammonia ligase)